MYVCTYVYKYIYIYIYTYIYIGGGIGGAGGAIAPPLVSDPYLKIICTCKIGYLTV